MTPDEFCEHWDLALDDPDRIWPEDVLTEEEWNRGWLDRQIIQGTRTEADRATTHKAFGGDAG